jgi:hypothetical protein
VYENDKVNIIDTNNIITHIIGIDFNSLYPSSYNSKHHPFNPYTDRIMYMPGPLKKVIKNEEEARKIIEERNEIFSVDVKGHIDKSHLNSVVNLLIVGLTHYLLILKEYLITKTCIKIV